MIARLSALPVALLLGAVPARADEPVLAGDRATLSLCLNRAKADQTAPEACIGAIYSPCSETDAAARRLGLVACADRETRAWEERLEAALQAASRTYNAFARTRPDGRGPETGPDMLREMEDAWLAYRDRKCGLAALPMGEVGRLTILGANCFMRETARQVIWLDDLVDR